MGKLFVTTVTSAKPREREYKLTDGAGLYLLAKPNGRKLWRLPEDEWARDKRAGRAVTVNIVPQFDGTRPTIGDRGRSIATKRA